MASPEYGAAAWIPFPTCWYGRDIQSRQLLLRHHVGQQLLVCWGAYGTRTKKAKYLPKLAVSASGSAPSASEPEAAATPLPASAPPLSIWAVPPSAERHQELDHQRGSSNVHLVIAQTNPEAGPRGINAFIVETDWTAWYRRQGKTSWASAPRYPHHYV